MKCFFFFVTFWQRTTQSTRLLDSNLIKIYPFTKLKSPSVISMYLHEFPTTQKLKTCASSGNKHPRPWRRRTEGASAGADRRPARFHDNGTRSPPFGMLHLICLYKDLIAITLGFAKAFLFNKRALHYKRTSSIS